MTFVLPRTEYRDLFYTMHFGPFDQGDFLSSAAAGDGDLSSFVFSHLSSSPFSSSTSDYSSDVVSTEQGDLITTQEESSSQPAFKRDGLALAGGVFTYSSAFVPDKDTWVDAAWCRLEERGGTPDSPFLRLLSVSNKQNVRQAALNDQYITDPLNIGDVVTSADSFSTGVLQPIPLSTKVDFNMRRRGQYNSRPFNLIPAGGMLLIVIDVVAIGMRDLRVSIRCRERRY